MRHILYLIWPRRSRKVSFYFNLWINFGSVTKIPYQFIPAVDEFLHHTFKDKFKYPSFVTVIETWVNKIRFSSPSFNSCPCLSTSSFNAKHDVRNVNFSCLHTNWIRWPADVNDFLCSNWWLDGYLPRDGCRSLYSFVIVLENMAKFVSFLLMIKDISKNSYTRLSNHMFRQHSSCLNQPPRSTDY